MREDRISRAVGALVARFHRQQPPRSGSLLITIFGDAIAPRGGAVTLGGLIKLGQPFALAERLVRTSIGRLAQDGWLKSRRAGRQSEYTLTQQGRARFTEATQRIYAAPPRRWNRHWTIALLPNGASQRERIREEMLWLGFGQLAPGVLIHPSRSVSETQGQLRTSPHAIALEAASAGLDADRRLVAASWDFADLTLRYRRLVEGFTAVRRLLGNATALSPQQAFVIRTLLIHEYRKIHLRDPLLPRDLLPRDWVGAEAYDLCRTLYKRVLSASEDWLSANASRLRGPLPRPGSATRQRFRLRKG